MAEIYILNAMHFEGINTIPLLKINYLEKKIDFSLYDALVLTSKNAAYAVDSFDSLWKTVPAYVIASKTAKEIEKLGGNVQFVGKSGHGAQFAQELAPLLKDKKALFLKAEKVVSNLSEILIKKGIDIEAVSVYETACNDLENMPKIAKNSIVIFSSPSTIECFFRHFVWDKSFKAVVIGQTTAAYLPPDIEYVIAPLTSMDACVQTAKALAARSNF